MYRQFLFAHFTRSAEILKFLELLFDCNHSPCYTSFTFDENLHEHISQDLADNVGRASDTS